MPSTDNAGTCTRDMAAAPSIAPATRPTAARPTVLPGRGCLCAGPRTGSVDTILNSRYLIQCASMPPAHVNGAVSLTKHAHCPNRTCVDYPEMPATASAMPAVAVLRGAPATGFGALWLPRGAPAYSGDVFRGHNTIFSSSMGGRGRWRGYGWHTPYPPRRFGVGTVLGHPSHHNPSTWAMPAPSARRRRRERSWCRQPRRGARQ